MSNPPSRADWPAEMRHAFETGATSGCIGSVLLSETDRVRVWHLSLPPGASSGFHRHVLPYFWTALADGRARTWHEDGHVTEGETQKGQTRHFEFGLGEHKVHCVENIGDADLDFTTVEFLDGPNPRLPVPDSVRAAAS